MFVSAASSAASEARAFTDAEFFNHEVDEGGGGGRWFTGAPADGFGCSVCHGGKPSERVVVEGLPADGYVPGETYFVRISWPDFANRVRGLYATQPANMLPRASLVAEFVAETGIDSGNMIQGTLKDSVPQELCHPATTNNRRRFGFQIFRKSVDEVGLPPNLTDTRVVNECFGQNFTRCLAAVKACGSEELRFTWVAPSDNQGAIWFAAGFVATDVMNARPDLDAVTEIRTPIPPRSSSGYESELSQSCSVRAGAGASHSDVGAAAPWLGLLGLGLWRTLRRRRGGRT